MIVTTSPFSRKVMDLIRAIPNGKVATYGQIAKLAGKPRGSRGVAWILHSSSTVHKLPWHRVINSQGKISFDKTTFNFRRQKKLLENEGVTFNSTGGVSLKTYQWKKKPPKTRRTPAGTPRMFR